MYTSVTSILVLNLTVSQANQIETHFLPQPRMIPNGTIVFHLQDDQDKGQVPHIVEFRHLFLIFVTHFIDSLHYRSSQKKMQHDDQNLHTMKQEEAVAKIEGAKKPAVMDETGQSAPQKNTEKPDYFQMFIQEVLPVNGPFEHIAEFLRVSDLVALSETHEPMDEAITGRLLHWKCLEDDNKNHLFCDGDGHLFLGEGMPFQCEECDHQTCGPCTTTMSCHICKKPGCNKCSKIEFCKQCQSYSHDGCK